MGPSGSQTTPQKSLTFNRPPPFGNENPATMESASEDSLGRLSLIGSSAAKIDQLDDIKTALKGLEEVKASQAGMTDN